jgi:hypothetical protein
MITTFLRLLEGKRKEVSLRDCCEALRNGMQDPRIFELDPEAFKVVPKAAFAYWVSENVRKTFIELEPFSGNGRAIKQGVGTSDDFRFARLWWEIDGTHLNRRWFTFAKGGGFSRYYLDLPLVVNWENDGEEIYAFPSAFVRNHGFYFLPGATWSDRTTKSFSARVWPKQGVFSVKGSAGFFGDDTWLAIALMNSAPFEFLISLLVGASDAAARSYQVGVISSVPFPTDAERNGSATSDIENLAKRSWSLKRTIDTVAETSHAFQLPTALRMRLGDYDRPSIEVELANIQAKIDEIAFNLYGFSNADRAAALEPPGLTNVNPCGGGEDTDDDEEDDSATVGDLTEDLLSWATGVAFGRFDWRLATGERAQPGEPEPFDPLPAKSPGMLQDDSEPFHAHAGILVDDQGHPHDLARLIEEVLVRIEAPVPEDVRRWLQRDFFAFHLQRYSKSRRKAPIYWPLSTTSGSFTLWVYYPSLTSQTLYSAINDFIEPKLKQVGGDVTALRNKGSARTRDDERQFEALQAFELELIELRDTLLKLAPTYKPNHEDGVQIAAAPLWPLFRHKPWQNVLKDTWAKLEKGDYDWAHLAINYWPDRVREKCKTDKSLAIAHGLEDLYIEPEAKPQKARGRKTATGDAK